MKHNLHRKFDIVNVTQLINISHVMTLLVSMLSPYLAL